MTEKNETEMKRKDGTLSCCCCCLHLTFIVIHFMFLSHSIIIFIINYE